MAEKTTIKFKVLQLSVKEDAKDWQIKIKNRDGIKSALSFYSTSIMVDNDFFDNKIKSLEREIAEVESNPDMFAGHKKTIKDLNDKIKFVEEDRERLSSLAIAEFPSNVEIADFVKGTLVLTIPENIIGELIKIRHDIQSGAFMAMLKA